jgi:hypothetical protein
MKGKKANRLFGRDRGSVIEIISFRGVQLSRNLSFIFVYLKAESF